MQRFLKNLIKTVGLFFLGCFAFLFSILLIFQFPAVQTSFAEFLTQKIINKTGYEIEIEKAYLANLNTLQLEEIRLLSNSSKELIGLNRGQISFRLRDFIGGSRVPVKDILLKEPKMVLSSDSSGKFELLEFFQKLELSDTTGNPKKLKINQIQILNGEIIFPELKSFKITREADFELETLKNLQLDLRNLNYDSDSLWFFISNLSFKEKHNDLSINLSSCSSTLKKDRFEFSGFNLKSDALDLGNSLVLEFSDVKGKRYLEKIKANLDSLRIKTPYLARTFQNPEMNQLPKDIWVVGGLEFTTNRLVLRNSQILSSKGSRIQGRFEIDQYGVGQAPFIQAQLRPSYLSRQDLSLLSKKLKLGLLENLEFLQFDGSFDGFPSDFVSKGNFNSARGKFSADINLKKPRNKDIPEYSGKLSLTDFDIGTLVGSEFQVDKVNLDGEVFGSGLKLEEISVIFDGQIQSVDILENRLSDITIKGNLSDRLFSGLVSSKDERLQLDLAGTVNLNDSSQRINLEIEANEILTQDFLKTEGASGFSLKGFANFQGFHPDSVRGYVDLSSIQVYNQEKELNFDSLFLGIGGPPQHRSISLRSDYFNAFVDGNFSWEAIKLIPKEIKALLEGLNLDAKKITREDHQSTSRLAIELKDANPLIGFFVPGLIHTGRSLIEANYIWGTKDHLDISISLDSIFYQGNLFYANRAHIDLNQDSANGSSLSLEIFGEEQYVGERTAIKNTKILLNHSKGESDLVLNSEMDDKDWFNMNLIGNGTLKEEEYKMSFDIENSDLTFLGKYWSLNTGNHFVINSNGLVFDSLGYQTQEEEIRVSGAFFGEENFLGLDLETFNLVNINPFIIHKLTGNASGNMRLKPSEGELVSKIRINDLTFNDLLVGDVDARISKVFEDGNLGVELNVEHLGEQYLMAEGEINARNNFLMDINATLRDVDLHFLGPILENVMSEISGSVSGMISLGGDFKSPEIDGELFVKAGTFKVDYLNTKFFLDQKVHMGIDRIIFSKSRVLDQNHVPVGVSGGIYHDGFKDFVVDMDLELNKNLIMDLEQEQNEYFFGTAVATGEISLFGSVQDVLIEADLSSDKGTQVFFPFDNAETVSQNNQIQFVSQIQAEPKKQKKKEEEVDLSGLTLKANLEVTPDAEIQLLLDQTTDDRIWGSGEGKMSMEIDTRGGFQMFGNYTIQKGIYNFTMLNIINKQFDIDPGSSISWNGDPYGGNIKVTGLYKQHVSLSPLMISADSLILQSPQARRRYPVDVKLFLNGEVLTPDIAFGVDIIETPVFAGYDFNSDKLAFYNRIQNDADEMNRQVFSLIMLRRFSQDGTYYGQSVSGNVSELLSNQLSNYLSQVDENFQIDFDLSGFSEQDLKNMQLRMSYQFMEGKLKVSREGGFYNATDEADVSSVIGDWTVEYLLSDDGRLRVRVFNRNNPNIYQTGLDGTSSTTTGGFSLMYTQNFNNLSELFQSPNKQNK